MTDMHSMKAGALGVLALACASLAHAQTGASPAAGGQAVRPIGAVTAIIHAQRDITIRTDAGSEMSVLFDEQTSFLRVAPGEKSLEKAAKITVAEVEVGDRILARGRVADDSKSVAATSVIVMAKTDIAKKQEADRAEWERRGIAGIVKAVNPETREITVTVPRLTASQEVIVSLADGARLRRYAPGSAKFHDAKPSHFDEVQAGDQLRALGTRSEDGTRLLAEEVVTGSFLVIAAMVEGVNPTDNTLEVSDLATQKKLRVQVNADSNLRRMPPYLAQMLAWRSQGEAAPGGGPAERRPPPMAGAPGPPAGAERGGAGEWRRPPMAGEPVPPGGAERGPGVRERPRDLQSMLERMPAIALAELKPGDAIAVTSARGADPSQLTAITILAGIEPLLTAGPEGGRQMVGSWNLNLNLEMGMP